MTLQNIVVAQYKPPHMEDLMLLQLKWLVPEGDPVTNQTTGGLLEKLNKYVNEISLNAVREKDMHYQYMKINSSPIKLFLVTVVLPSTAFIVFFFYIIFFTGSNKNQVSYRPLLDLSEKESTI